VSLIDIKSGFQIGDLSMTSKKSVFKFVLTYMTANIADSKEALSTGLSVTKGKKFYNIECSRKS